MGDLLCLHFHWAVGLLLLHVWQSPLILLFDDLGLIELVLPSNIAHDIMSVWPWLVTRLWLRLQAGWRWLHSSLHFGVPVGSKRILTNRVVPYLSVSDVYCISFLSLQ